MAKLEVTVQDLRAEISALQSFRSGWVNNVRESWNLEKTKEIFFELYEIAGSIILALQAVEAGVYCDKMAMILVRRKLERLVKSEAYDMFAAMTEAGMCRVITTGTQHHIRVMFKILDKLTA